MTGFRNALISPSLNFLSRDLSERACATAGLLVLIDVLRISD